MQTQSRNLIQGRKPVFGNKKQIEFQKKREMQFLGLWACGQVIPSHNEEGAFQAHMEFDCIIKQCPGSVSNTWTFAKNPLITYGQRLQQLKDYFLQNQVWNINQECDHCKAEYEIRTNGDLHPVFEAFYILQSSTQAE